MINASPPPSASLPALGDVFCLSQSYRAERGGGRRHLAEYTLVECEGPFVDFEELLGRVEALVCDLVDRVLATPDGAACLRDLNPGFKPPKYYYYYALEWNRNGWWLLTLVLHKLHVFYTIL